MSSPKCIKLFVGTDVLCENQHNNDPVLMRFNRLKSAVQDGNSLSIRWVKQANLHLTLCFLGQVKVDQVPKVVQAIQATLKDVRPFILKIGQLGYLRSCSRPHHIILEVYPSQPLMALANCLNQALTSTGKPLNHGNTFIPHITLGKIKGVISSNIEWPKLVEESIQINRVHLYESISLEGGVRYHKRETFSLI